MGEAKVAGERLLELRDLAAGDQHPRIEHLEDATFFVLRDQGSGNGNRSGVPRLRWVHRISL